MGIWEFFNPPTTNQPPLTENKPVQPLQESSTQKELVLPEPPHPEDIEQVEKSVMHVRAAQHASNIHQPQIVSQEVLKPNAPQTPDSRVEITPDQVEQKQPRVVEIITTRPEETVPQAEGTPVEPEKQVEQEGPNARELYFSFFKQLNTPPPPPAISSTSLHYGRVFYSQMTNVEEMFETLSERLEPSADSVSHTMHLQQSLEALPEFILQESEAKELDPQIIQQFFSDSVGEYFTSHDAAHEQEAKLNAFWIGYWDLVQEKVEDGEVVIPQALEKAYTQFVDPKHRTER